MNCRLIAVLLFVVTLAAAADGPRVPDPASRTNNIRFTENRGQVADAAGLRRPEIKYTAEAQGVRLYFLPHGISTVFTRVVAQDETGFGMPSIDHGLPGSDSVLQYRLDMQFMDCNSSVRVRGVDELQGYSNYYYPHCPDGVLRVPSFGRIVYENLWDGIDMMFSSSGGRVKYAFTVHPGGDVSRIRMRYLGADAVAVDADGNLVVTTPLGRMDDDAPESYQHGVKIGSRFHVNGHEVSIDVAAYDTTATLTIDPWATYYGGSLNDVFRAVTIDASGDYLACGSTSSTNFPVQNAWQPANGGGLFDVCILKLSPSQTLIWATYYGGNDQDDPATIAADGNRNICVGGGTNSPNFPVSAVTFQGTRAGTNDGFIIALNPQGSRIWASYLGGSSEYESVYGVVFDLSGKLYVTGLTGSSNFPVTSGAYQTTLGGLNDAFVLCFSSLSASPIQLEWSTYVGGSANDRFNGIRCSGSKLALHGSTLSDNFPVTTAAFQSTRAGNEDAILASFTTGGSLQWSTYFGGSGVEQAGRIAVDDAGNIFVAGSTESTNFPVLHALQSSPAGLRDLYIAKFSSDGYPSWSTFYGGSNNEWGGNGRAGLAVDANAGVYISCSTASNNFPVQQAVQSSNAGGNDAGLIKLDSSGTRIWATYFGGSGTDEVYGDIANDPNGFFLIGGYSSSSNFPVFNPLQGTNAGGNDGFLIQMTSSGQMSGPAPTIQTSTLAASSFCPGASIQVPFTTSGTFNANNTFTAQLSNATGSFAAPTSIGTLQGTQPGTINCVIPASASPGSGYRIRVRSSSPVVSGTDNGSNLTIHAIPVATITPTDTVPLCPSAGVPLSAATGSGFTYQWLRDGTPVSGAMASTHNATSAGAYAVIISNSNSCADTSSVTTVVAAPGDTTHLVWTGALSNAWGTRGNWDHPCATPGTGDTVVIQGSMGMPAQAPAVTLSVLEMDNPGTLNLGGRLRITSALILRRGYIDVARGGVLLDSGAAVIGGSDTSHLITSDTAALIRAGIGSGGATGALLFPVGPELASYSPVELVNTGVVDDFRVRVVKGVRENGSSGAQRTANVVDRTWFITEGTAGGSDVTLTLHWTLVAELAGFVRDRSMIARYAGASWANLQAPDAAAGSNPFSRSVPGIGSFSAFAVGDSLARLPVELLGLSATVRGSEVLLAWKTAGGMHSAGFSIERAAARSGPWETRGFVPCAGSADHNQHYEYHDPVSDDPTTGRQLCYRISIIDADGNADFSPVLEVNTGSTGLDFAIDAVYPQPAQGTANIVLRLPEQLPLSLVLCDGLGRVLRVYRSSVPHCAGVHAIPLPLADLLPGTYWLRAYSGARVVTRHIIIQ